MNNQFRHQIKWIELSRKNLFHNIDLIRSYSSPDIQIAALLKANAYGHGISEMSALYHQAGIDVFMVHEFKEAETLYKIFPDKRIIVIGPLMDMELKASIKLGIEFTVYQTDTLNQIKKISKKSNPAPKLHIKIETGTYRQGLEFKEIPSFIKTLKQLQRFKIKGISSHFANIEDTSDTKYYKKQLRVFQKAVQWFEKENLKPDCCHIACSAAVFLYPETHFQMIRPGIALYGYYSSRELAYSLKLKEGLKPVLSFRTRISQIKEVPKGKGIGYGLTYKTTRKTKLGILPTGYYDGYDRKLSGTGICLLGGKRANVCGRICMNMTLVDLTDISDCKVGDQVTLIGKDGQESITADEIASMTNTISYEILARLNPEIPRFIV